MEFIDPSKPKSLLSVRITMKKITIIALFICTIAISVVAQKTVLTKEDYARAEKMLSFGTAPYVDRGGVRPTFLPDGRFWYRVLTATGSEYVLINPADGSRKSAANLADLGITAPAGPAGGGRFGGGNAVSSPDGKKQVYIKEWNLWVKDIATGKETQLTTDGVKDFGYATDNAGWKHSDRAIVLWSRTRKRSRRFSRIRGT